MTSLTALLLVCEWWEKVAVKKQTQAKEEKQQKQENNLWKKEWSRNLSTARANEKYMERRLATNADKK